MRRFAIGLAAIGWAANVSAGPSNLGSWQPAAAFKIQPASDRCVAISAFKRGEENLIIALEGNPTTNDFAMRLYGPGNLRGEPRGQGTYSLGGVKPETSWVVARKSNQAGILIYELRITRPELDSAGPSPELRIPEAERLGPLTLAGLQDAIPLIGTCSVELLERWGYSEDFQRELATRPEPKKKLFNYASPSDYPLSAVAARAEGDTYALVEVGVDGRASNCRVIRSSGNKEIDKTTCMIVTRRARYNPAQTRRGEPVAAPYYLTFRWEIPRL